MSCKDDKALQVQVMIFFVCYYPKSKSRLFIVCVTHLLKKIALVALSLLKISVRIK